ncbi:MAG TPA: thermonuclease family protein [Vicinamibacterales bacterium]|nr:thermonuclease family protein [Vicinamibacterales bacterium]
MRAPTVLTVCVAGAVLVPAALVLAAASSQSSPRAASPRLPRPDQSFAVRFVLDGDTLDVSGVGRVRLLGIDAPESGRGLETPAPFAREARDRLTALAAGRWVRLELDGEPRDSYRRALAYVIRTDGLLLNAEMLRAGLARISARRPLRRLGELQRAEEEAQRFRRGMWGDRPSLPDRVFRVPR